MKRTFFRIAGFTLALSMVAAAQSTNVTNVGTPPNGTFHGSEVDSVQANNGNLHVEIPLFTLPGRGLPVSCPMFMTITDGA